MKINKELLDKIYNLEVNIISIEGKHKLSLYEEYIPMYDIRSQRIYPIYKKNLYNSLNILDFRFINDEIYDWLHNKYNKYKTTHYKYNVIVMDNYIINILYDTSLKALYKYSPSVGMNISICKRNSFNYYIEHLKPYYSKLELIKLGQNKNLINKHVSLDNLLNKEVHYKMCLKISNDDVSAEEIEEHHEYIYNNKNISWICFYSFIGFYLFNNYLRFNNVLDNILVNGLHKIIKTLEHAPALKKKYNIYRFIYEDEFIIKLKVGDIFSDNGLMSTTRDPFYSPGVTGYFGLILVKINIPKNIKGIGLFIENFSLFPIEEEFILPPFVKLKLKAKNSNFKYYHPDPKFENLITKKYEFDLINTNYKKYYNEYYKIHKSLSYEHTYFDLNNINISGASKLQMLHTFIKKYSTSHFIYIQHNNKQYKFLYQWFDSSNNSAYEQLYFNKIKEGLMLSLINTSGYLYLNIEFGNHMCINHINKTYYGKQLVKNYKLDLDIINSFGKLFGYNKIYIINEYNSFIDFKKNYLTIPNTYLLSSYYNKSLYNYLKYNKQYLSNTKYTNQISYPIKFSIINKYFNSLIKKNSLIYIPYELTKYTTYKDLYIALVEKYFYYYKTLIHIFNNNIINTDYIIFHISLPKDKENIIYDISYENKWNDRFKRHL